jgi:hypothetical protein
VATFSNALGHSVILDSTYVYWTTDNGVFRVPK